MSEHSRPTVLVVEDNETVADTYAAFLADTYEIRTAYDGEQALTRFDGTVDVVLLDRRMPGLSGGEVLDELRERDADVQVVVVTAVDPELDVVEMPFDAYVVKPVEREELRSIVADVLDRTEYDDDLREFLALASKRATLELKRTEAELEGSEQYHHVCDRLAEMRADLGVETERLKAIVDGQPPGVDGESVVADE
jgi:DNA-binding response OmpR family regulator